MALLYCSSCRKGHKDGCPKQKVEIRPRGTRSERGYDQDWLDFRSLYLKDPVNRLCADCLEYDNRPVPAKDLHHIRKLSDYPHLRLDRNNIRPLCKRHHSIRTARGE